MSGPAISLGIACCVTQSAMFSGCKLAFYRLRRLRLEVESRRDPRGLEVLVLRRDILKAHVRDPGTEGSDVEGIGALNAARRSCAAAPGRSQSMNVSIVAVPRNEKKPATSVTVVRMIDEAVAGS